MDAVNGKSSRTTELNGALEKIVMDVGTQLAEKHDRQAVDKVMGSLAEQFRGAHVTAFLPTLIMKTASERLRDLSRVIAGKTKA